MKKKPSSQQIYHFGESKRNSEQFVKREVIEKQLLTSLEDKSKVAILATEQDLELLIAALSLAESNRMSPFGCKQFRLDLEQLKDAAF